MIVRHPNPAGSVPVEETIKGLLFHPAVGRIVAAVVVVLLVLTVSRLLQRSIGRVVKDVDARYRARKFVNFIGYFVAFPPVAVVSGDRGEITLPVTYGSGRRPAREMLRDLVDEVLAGYAEQVKDSWKEMLDRTRLASATFERVPGSELDVSISRRKGRS